MAAALWTRLADCIAQRTGLHYPPHKLGDLQRGIRAAASEFGFDDPVRCASWLLAEPWDDQRLQVLVRRLAIGETHFFRDPPCWDALAVAVLPALIAARCTERRLRVWSAACSTGEETYTLAVLLHRLLPDGCEWDVDILGTDINDAALRRAREGVYGEWSFRGAPSWLRPLYFQRTEGGRFRINDALRQRVRFQNLNLIDHARRRRPSAPVDLDLILCRNATMYFTPDCAAEVMQALRDSLRDDGRLMLAAVEHSAAARVAGLKSLSCDNVQLLCRVPVPGPACDTAAAGPAWSVPLACLTTTPAQRTVVSDACDERDAQSLARAYADQGRLDEALQCCDQWLATDKLDPAAHYTRAVVLLEHGDVEAARQSLQRATFLQPGFVMAHIALGHAELRRGLSQRAARHFDNARRALSECDADAAVPESHGLHAGELREALCAISATERPQ